MIANRLIMKAFLDSIRVPVNAAGISNITHRIGNREIVGFGYNGQPMYLDRGDFPMPAIRFKEDTPDVVALREKEKGDWRKLSIEEKKALYRASFCQTFSEFEAPNGEWKFITGWVLILASLSLWLMMALRLWVLNPLPITMSEERMKAQLKRKLDLKMDPIEGISSMWDYENNRWKK